METSKAYKFCPQCGAPLEQKNSELLVCQNNHPLYINPRPTVSAIITNEEGEILMTHRSEEPKKDWWDLPGGFVSLGETLEQGLIRELQEELAVKIRVDRYFASLSGKYLYKGINYPVLDCIFLAAIVSGELKAGDDVADFKFFSKDDLPTEIAFETHRKALSLFVGKQ